VSLNIYVSLHPEKLRTWLLSAFSDMGIKSPEILANDNLVDKAARTAYKRIPLFPFRAAIKAAVGEEGFVAIVFKIRDKMIESKSMNLSWLDMDYLRSILPLGQNGFVGGNHMH
jgi:hypothetical protein